MKRTVVLLRTALVCAVLLCCQGAYTQPVSLTNTYAPTAKKGYMNWTVYLKGSTATFASINYVEYTLHPTFPKPVQQIRASKTNPAFSVSASGWGEFELKAKIVFRSPAQRPLYLNYQLDLHSPDKNTFSKGK